MHEGHFLQSSLLRRAGVRHAFFTRLGGVSTGDLASLNAAVSVGDDPERVEENLTRAAGALGVGRDRLFLASQVHGKDVVVVTAESDPEGVASARADALASNAAGVALGVRTADCVPVLLADPDAGAASAVHAGWRGVEQGVVAQAVKRLCGLGARAERVMAAIGPHIGADAFEVGEDVALRLAAASRATDVVRQSAGRKPRVNLARIVQAQLEAAGVLPSRVERVEGCTFSDARRFYSHRRDGNRSGRLLSAIVTPWAP